MSWREHFCCGYGRTGLVVGLPALGSLMAVAAVSLLLAFLTSGGINLQLAAEVPASSAQIVQGVPMLLIAAAMLWSNRRAGGAA
ncbi:hypothetical protein ACIOKD_36530 [Streptomyces sp. NPDC087844]|uniref:hypothetical protein n=1 Tax=Streptomyces sp. NPDC087844 TaxID=3365805 RepID=UPI0037F3C592